MSLNIGDWMFEPHLKSRLPVRCADEDNVQVCDKTENTPSSQHTVVTKTVKHPHTQESQP